MSRLIDADELKKQLEHGVWNDIIKEIDDTPTAFDIKKVMERLEEQEEKHFHHDFDNDRFEFGAYVASVTAIEIVKEEMKG